jgi:integrase
MASISKDAHGNHIVQFVGAGRRRWTIRLGRVSKRAAETIALHVEKLNTAKIMGQPVEAETARFVAKCTNDLADRLARVELIAPRQTAPKAALGNFLDEYIERRKDVKPATKEVWGQVVRNLTTHFGVDRDISTINEGDADGFKLYLMGLGTLARTTISKRLQFARMFFRAMMRRKLIPSNPFAEVSSKAGAQGERQFFVTREATARLLAVCGPDWRLIVALSRYGGLRTPSETLSLRWIDINWDSGRIVVTSPKTEHHPGKETRVIPLFGELRPILTEAFESAPDGAEFVVGGGYREAANTPGGWRNCNLRSQLLRIIKRAGLVAWERPFHALRGSRETELAKEYPLHVATAWMGNTPRIAMKHYLMTTDADFDRATRALHPALQPESEVSDSKGNLETGAYSETAVISPKSPKMEFSVHANSGEDRIRTCGRV